MKVTQQYTPFRNIGSVEQERIREMAIHMYVTLNMTASEVCRKICNEQRIKMHSSGLTHELHKRGIEVRPWNLAALSMCDNKKDNAYMEKIRIPDADAKLVCLCCLQPFEGEGEYCDDCKGFKELATE